MFSVDTQQLKNENLNFFSITEPCRDNLKWQFLIKSCYYIVPSPSTALGKSKVLTMPTTRMCWSRRCWGWRKGRRGPLCYSATGVLPCSAAWTVVQAWSLCKVSSVCLRGRCGGHCGGHQCLVVVMVIEESKSTVIGCHRTFMCNFKYCIVYL